MQAPIDAGRAAGSGMGARPRQKSLFAPSALFPFFFPAVTVGVAGRETERSEDQRRSGGTSSLDISPRRLGFCQARCGWRHLAVARYGSEREGGVVRQVK